MHIKKKVLIIFRYSTKHAYFWLGVQYFLKNSNYVGLSKCTVLVYHELLAIDWKIVFTLSFVTQAKDVWINTWINKEWFNSVMMLTWINRPVPSKWVVTCQGIFLNIAHWTWAMVTFCIGMSNMVDLSHKCYVPIKIFRKYRTWPKKMSFCSYLFFFFFLSLFPPPPLFFFFFFFHFNATSSTLFEWINGEVTQSFELRRSTAPRRTSWMAEKVEK